MLLFRQKIADLGLFKVGVIFFCVGIGLAANGSWALFFVSFCFLCVFAFVRRSLFVAVMFLVLGALGFLRYEWAMSGFGPQEAAYYNDQVESVALEGWVSAEPDVRSDRVRLTVDIERMADVGPVKGRVLVTLPRYPDDYFYGMMLRFSGSLQTPAEFEDFSYRNYLRRYGILSVMYEPFFLEKVEGRAHQNLWSFLYAFKRRLEHRLNRLFPEPESSFSAGLLLGSRRSIPSAILEAFNTTGLTHLLAISGYNITLLILFIAGMFRFLPQRWQILLSTVLIILFVILVGASAAVVRAAFMGILGLWAVWFRRPSEARHLLFLSAGVMGMWNPFLITDDVGFQLSFAATAGLIYCTDPLEKFFKRLRIYEKIPTFFAMRESLMTTLAAQVFATPLIVVYFGRFSLIAPLANICVAPIVPLAMLFSAAALLVSAFWWEGGLLIAYVASFFLDWILEVADLGARIL